MSRASREELVERARGLAAGIRELSGKTEQDRVVPPETFQAFKDAELLRAFVPDAYGGHALDFPTVIEISREIARACGSSGWCLAICTLHNGMVAGLSAAAQEEVFGPSPDSVVCGVFMPGGVATAVEGGYRLTGGWDFASGCDHASHALLAAGVRPDPEADPTGFGNFLVRREDFSIEDNWYVAGLSGTGSRRVVVEDVFVAEEFSSQRSHGQMAENPSASERGKRDGGFRGLPMNSVATLGLAGVPIGIARGALEDFRDRLASKVRVGTFRGPQDQVGAQMRLSEAAAEVDSVELLVLRDCEEMERTFAEGKEATLEQRGRYRRDAAYAFHICARAVARLLPASGAHSIFRDNPLQRALRDTQVMAAHIVADWDMSRETYAKALLELPIDDPVF